MRFEYDSSFPDTDPYEPQPGGCLSLFPFMLGDLVEIPVTMPQDHTQFRLLGLRDTSVWKQKAEAISSRNGLICMLTHPDTSDGYAGSEQVMGFYREMLSALSADESKWNALPRDVARWWRARSQSNVDEGGTSVLGQHSEGMSVGRASLRDGQLVLERAEPSGWLQVALG